MPSNGHGSPARSPRHETVAEHVVATRLSLHVNQTVHEAREALLSSADGARELLLVCDQTGHFAGAMPLGRLFGCAPALTLGEVMTTDFPRVHPTDEQESAASLALHHRVDALAVVDQDGFPVGIVPAQALLQILRREHVEDLHRLAGINRETARARHAIEDPPLRRARHRMPWLLVGFAGSVLSTAAMASFEHTLSTQIATAFFVPGIIYLADAIGTQSEAIAVRGLSLTRGGITHLLLGELRTGMLIGSMLALLAWPLVWFFFSDPRLATAVSAALLFAGSCACLIGFGLPWLLAKYGVDPAYGSGPLATILQDILSLLVYMASVHLLMF